MVVTALYDTVSKRRQEEPGQNNSKRKSVKFKEILAEKKQKQLEDRELEGMPIGYDRTGMQLYYQMTRKEYR